MWGNWYFVIRQPTPLTFENFYSDAGQCSPEDRPWSGPRCDRCESYGYDCSENMMARKPSQREVKSSRTINRPKNRPGQQSPTRPLLMLSSQPLMNGSMLEAGLRESPFVGLFVYLKDIDWLSLSCPPAQFGSDPFAAMFQSYSCLPNLIGPPLGKRQMFLEVFAESERLKQNPTTPPPPYNPVLENPVVTAIVTKLQREQHRMEMPYSFEELSRRCSNYIRYGSCWQILRTLLSTDEVLLIDPKYSFDKPNPETTFEAAVHIWLYQIPGLREFCQKLSGLSHMILNLAKTEPSSPIRLFLATKILDRLNEVLGPGVSSPPPHSVAFCNMNSNGNSNNKPPLMSLATIESPPVKLRDVESDDSFSFDDSLPAGFGSGHVYQGPWNS
ncbi:hypothetical protein PABG_02086 [Paracoccidioides brasiliensis Pb03]|nr:hypothetical protein PABG_02086 [Paracoccidioides brasiliensis Pb03]